MKEEAEAVMHTAKDVLENIVVVVSLVHTLTETFGSASDLYRKIKRKAGSSVSDDEDDNRRAPRRRLSHRRRDSSSDSDHDHRRRHLRWNLDARNDESSDSDEELIVTSSSQVRAEYERGYKKLGEPFARGDLMTQNQLQAQIIELQRTLLSIHQDYMLSTYLSPSSSNSHLIRLIQTTRTARIASIHALHMQYERLLLAPAPDVPDCPPTIPGAYPNPPHKIPRRDSMVHRPHSRPGHRSQSSSPHVPSDDKEYRIQPFPNPSSAPKKLFCVYARDLQEHGRLPLTDNYKADGNNLCPFCRTHIAVKPGRVWELVVDDCKGHGAKKTFLIKNRFVVKSHREGGGFACVLCAKYKPADTVCREIGSLMEHLWRDHNSEEMEKDEDIVEADD